jgi:hypothetical protein
MQTRSILLLALLASTACSSSSADDPTTRDELGAGESSPAPRRIPPGEFKLYGSPEFQMIDSCSSHVALELTGDGKANLATHVMHPCDVSPNHRTYDLKLERSECGTSTYFGERRDANDRKFTIVLTDHRERNESCPRPASFARIIVDEAGPERGDDTQTWYSDDR